MNTAVLAGVAVVATAGTLVGTGALRSIRRDPAQYGRGMIVASMGCPALLGAVCGPFAVALLYAGAGGAIVGMAARTALGYTAWGVVFSLLVYVDASTIRAMNRYRKAVEQ